MPRSISYDKLLVGHLKDPQEAAAYLNAVLEEGDLSLFLKALKQVAQAQGGMTRLASRAGYSRYGLYKILSVKGNPGLKTVGEILRAFNLGLRVQPARSPAGR